MVQEVSEGPFQWIELIFLPGNGVNCYIIDTGVYVEHSEFRGRAEHGFSAITGEANTDLNGIV